MQHPLLRPQCADSVCGRRWRRTLHRRSCATVLRGPKRCCAASALAPPLIRQRQEQALFLERVIDGLEIDSLAALGFHGSDDIRGLVAAEAVRNVALVTVPIGSTLAVSIDEDGGQLSVLAPPEMPPNVKKAIEIVAGLIRETPDHQLLILSMLLLWARKYGSTAWRHYCEILLPPTQELSCLLCYSPGELSSLQLPHMVDEASRQHDWARWAHSQWLSSSSGALRRLGLAEKLEDTLWALAVVRSRAVEFETGLTAGSGFGSGSGSGSGLSRVQQQRQRWRRQPAGPIVSMLAPVVDLANHSNDPNCVVQLTTDRSRVVLLPRRSVAAGELLTVDYGFDRSSLELMADYGFVTSANPNDGEVALPEADKLPPLELSRLEAAARALLRRRQRRRQAVAAPAAARAVRQGFPAAAAAAEFSSTARDGGGGDGGVGNGRNGNALSTGNEKDEDEDGGRPDNGALAEAAAAEAAEAEALVLMPEGDVEEAKEEEEHFRGRLKAAVTLLAQRTAAAPFTATGSGGGGGGGSSLSTPATHRIIAGLWHKLVRHCADSLPTSLEQDKKLLEEIFAGRVSGFIAGPSLTLDPAAAAPPQLTPPVQPAAAAPVQGESGQPRSPGGKRQATADASQVCKVAVDELAGPVVPSPPSPPLPPQARRDAAAANGGKRAVRSRGDSSRDAVSIFSSSGQSAAAAEVGPAAATAGPAAASFLTEVSDRGGGGGSDCDGSRARQLRATAGLPGTASDGATCRTGRLTGRLYAAVRARLEHKELLSVAEDLLLQYGRS